MPLVIARSLQRDAISSVHPGSSTSSDIEKYATTLTIKPAPFSDHSTLADASDDRRFWFQKSKSYNPNAIATQPSVFDDPELVAEYKPQADWESVHRFDPSARWTWGEENRAARKLDMRIMVLACMMMTAMELDRSNIQQANADDFLSDLGLSRNGLNHPDYNLGNSIFKLFYLLSEIPAQLIGKYIGVDKWIPIQMTSWSLVALSTVSQYFTLLMKDFGFGEFNVILLAIPCSVLGIVTRIILTYAAEIFGSLAWMGVLSQAWTLPMLIYMNVVDFSQTKKWIGWTVLTLILSFPSPHALQAGWNSRNSNSVRSRALSAAMYNICVQISGIIASNVYQDWDAPRYVLGNRVLLALVCTNMAVYAATKGYYILRNRQRDRKWLAMTEEQRIEYIATTKDTGNKRLDFRSHLLGQEEVRDTEPVLDAPDSDDEMSTNRPPMHRSTDGRSQQPLLKDERGRLSNSSFGNGAAAEGRPMLHHHTRRPTIRSSSPEHNAEQDTRRKYIIASGFLLLSLASFVVQTETAVYISSELGWDKPYCMLYLTHGSWTLLWPVQLLILRLQKRKMSWDAFWRRHIFLLRTTAQMVESQDVHVSSRRSPIPYMLKTTAFVTLALTVAGGSWYLAVNMTTASDLTAIYNCSAFFAYAFSIPLLKDKLRFDKVFAVIVAIVGVLVVAYGDGDEGNHADGTPGKGQGQVRNRLLGNLIIGIGSVLYGLYEVLYKKFACPPEGTSPGRSMIFANTFGSLIGCFTLLVLWIPLPVLHILGWETFRWPTGEAAWMLLISVCANATFSGSFLVLISLTSPVLSSVASLLTIFLVAIVDWLRTGQPLASASIIGGILIITAFFLLSWSTYREMNEERKKSLENDQVESDSDD
ncbi:hypothetical protein ETB97_001391 [Aspergillus alliaceus]|uniref:EamA domain-containing protein n=2 Tax=Petromyces alliaceus TaxID=209559 RepID=A0A8H6A726_PETAA|nr:hypothetical protein ETB97_001391 [Aspergillus burnettii]